MWPPKNVHNVNIFFVQIFCLLFDEVLVCLVQNSQVHHLRLPVVLIVRVAVCRAVQPTPTFRRSLPAQTAMTAHPGVGHQNMLGAFLIRGRGCDHKCNTSTANQSHVNLIHPILSHPEDLFDSYGDIPNR